jgi:hypothetical protein
MIDKLGKFTGSIVKNSLGFPLLTTSWLNKNKSKQIHEGLGAIILLLATPTPGDH